MSETLALNGQRASGRGIPSASSTSFALAALLAVVAVPMSRAAVIDYTFTGSVSLVQNLPSVRLGDSFSASLRVDTGLATIAINSPPVQTDYDFPSGGAYALSVQLGHYSGSSARGQVSILDNFGPGQDWFQTRTAPGAFSGSTIDGLTWTQTDLTLKDYQGRLYHDTSLPTQIAALNNFEEAFGTMYFDPLGRNGIVNADIRSIQAVLSNSAAASVPPGSPTVVLNPGQAGGMVVTSQTAGNFTATYSQQAVGELDPRTFNFLVNGDIFQVWQLHFDGTIPPGRFVDLVFTYDDTGMSMFDELSLDVLHEVNGRYIPLGGIVDIHRNTITARTPSFSNFVLGTAVPEPATFALMALGLAGLGWFRRGRAAA